MRHVREGELGDEHPERAFGLLRVAGDHPDGLEASLGAEEHRTREAALEQEKLDDALALHLLRLVAAERLEAAARPEQRREPVAGPVHQPRHARQQHARRRVGALEVRAELEELERLAARERRLRHALEGVRALPDPNQELVRRLEHAGVPGPRHEQVEPVQVLPHLAGDLLPDAAKVLAGARDAGGHGVRVARMPEQELGHGLRRVLREVLAEELVPPDRTQQVAPLLLRIAHARIEQAVKADVEQPARVLGALDRPRRPEERLCDTAQHQSPQHPGVLAAAALRGVDDERARLHRGAGEPAGDDGRDPAGEDERPEVDVRGP